MAVDLVLDASIGSIPARFVSARSRSKDRPKTGNVEVDDDQSIETHMQRYEQTRWGTRVSRTGYPLETMEFRSRNIGDSFTLGIQVAEDETAVHLPCCMVHPAAPPLESDRYRMECGGVTVTGTVQATGLAKRLMRTQTRSHRVAFLSGERSQRQRTVGLPFQRSTAGHGGRSDPNSERWNHIHRFLSRWSRLYAHMLAWSAMRQAASDPRLQEMADELTPYVDANARLRLLPSTQAALQQFGALCQETSIPCIVSWVPPAHVIHKERSDATFDIFGLDGAQSDPKAVVESLNSILPKSLTQCDTTDALTNAAQEEDLYFIFDPHWTPGGHRVAAQAEADCIQTVLNKDSF